MKRLLIGLLAMTALFAQAQAASTDNMPRVVKTVRVNSPVEMIYDGHKFIPLATIPGLPWTNPLMVELVQSALGPYPQNEWAAMKPLQSS
jgi:hypothetical protein